MIVKLKFNQAGLGGSIFFAPAGDLADFGMEFGRLKAAEDSAVVRFWIGSPWPYGSIHPRSGGPLGFSQSSRQALPIFREKLGKLARALIVRRNTRAKEGQGQLEEDG
jgi:hypothetical protein